MKPFKGFTLVEVLAVIVIIGILSTIVSATFLSFVKNFKFIAYNEQLESINTAARMYISENKDLYNFGYDYIYLNDLISGGYIEGNLVNPIDSTTIDPNLKAVFFHKDDDGTLIFNLVNIVNPACFTFDSPTGKITDFDNYCDYSSDFFVIPKLINGVAVQRIDYSPRVESSVLVMPHTVTYLNYNAFTTSHFSSVYLSENLTYIGQYAFSHSRLVKVKIPPSVVMIDHGAFKYNQLIDVILPTELPLIIKTEVFAYNKLASINISNNVINIEDSAFRSNELTSLTLPSTITSIGVRAFADNKIGSLSYPSTVSSIGGGAFANNLLPPALAYINGGTSFPSIFSSYGGAAKTGVVIPSTYTSIATFAFLNSSVISVTIPNTITAIRREAFFNNKLTAISIPASVTTIEVGAFNCNNMANNAAAFIGSGTSSPNQLSSYAGASKTGIVIPGTFSSIVASFSDFWNEPKAEECKLQGVTIPSSILTIGADAFNDNALTSAVIQNGPTTIGNYAFRMNDLTAIAIPNSVTSIGTEGFAFNKILQNSATIDRTAGSLTLSASAFKNNGVYGSTTITPVYLR